MKQFFQRFDIDIIKYRINLFFNLGENQMDVETSCQCEEPCEICFCKDKEKVAELEYDEFEGVVIGI